MKDFRSLIPYRLLSKSTIASRLAASRKMQRSFPSTKKKKAPTQQLSKSSPFHPACSATDDSSERSIQPSSSLYTSSPKPMMLCDTPASSVRSSDDPNRASSPSKTSNRRSQAVFHSDERQLTDQALRASPTILDDVETIQRFDAGQSLHLDSDHRPWPSSKSFAERIHSGLSESLALADGRKDPSATQEHWASPPLCTEQHSIETLSPLPPPQRSHHVDDDRRYSSHTVRNQGVLHEVISISSNSSSTSADGIFAFDPHRSAVNESRTPATVTKTPLTSPVYCNEASPASQRSGIEQDSPVPWISANRRRFAAGRGVPRTPSMYSQTSFVGHWASHQFFREADNGSPFAQPDQTRRQSPLPARMDQGGSSPTSVSSSIAFGSHPPADWAAEQTSHRYTLSPPPNQSRMAANWMFDGQLASPHTRASRQLAGRSGPLAGSSGTAYNRTAARINLYDSAVPTTSIARGRRRRPAPALGSHRNGPSSSHRRFKLPGLANGERDGNRSQRDSYQIRRAPAGCQLMPKMSQGREGTSRSILFKPSAPAQYCQEKRSES